MPVGKNIFWGIGVAMVVAEYFRKVRNELKTKNKALEIGLEEKNRALEQANMALHEEIMERRQAERQLTEMNRQLRDLSARLHAIREEERTRIAREIHDVLGQQLTVLKMDIAWLNRKLTDESLREKAKAMLATADETLQSVRKLATELRPGVLDDLGLIAAIEWQCREFESRTGIRCMLNTDLHDLDCAKEIATAVFRIFQETLTNILRHAQATEIVIAIRVNDNVLYVEISDNGRGIKQEEINNGRSLGLLGMKERMNMVGGELQITGAPGKGTMVKLVIPLQLKGNG